MLSFVALFHCTLFSSKRTSMNVLWKRNNGAFTSLIFLSMQVQCSFSYCNVFAHTYTVSYIMLSFAVALCVCPCSPVQPVPFIKSSALWGFRNTCGVFFFFFKINSQQILFSYFISSMILITAIVHFLLPKEMSSLQRLSFSIILLQ